MKAAALFGAGVLVGLALPWAVMAWRDWRGRGDGQPDGTAARARAAWGDE